MKIYCEHTNSKVSPLVLFIKVCDECGTSWFKDEQPPKVVLREIKDV